VAVEVTPVKTGGAVPSSVVVTDTGGSPACTRKANAAGLDPPVNVTVRVKSICNGHATEFDRLN
jgi:hypothetical protein